MPRKLNTRQRAFVDAYDGNATKAAITAGYSKTTAYSQGNRLLKHVGIMRAIKDREKARSDARIADREERQAFWSDTVRGKLKDADGNPIEVTMAEKLKASELLGRSEADFTEVVDNKFPGGLPGLSIEGVKADEPVEPEPLKLASGGK